MAAPTAIEHTYRYPFASQLVETAGTSMLQLATSQRGDLFPYFFEGKILHPRATAELLTTLAKVVSSRYYIPPNMLNRILLERDPVVTAGAGILRFEGFSACCSTYVRVDLTPDAYQGKFVGHGTTNVDFNPPMRASLARVRDGDRLSISVGPDEFAVKRGFEHVVERKVELPLRWLKGFVEVQAYQSAMELRFKVGNKEAIRFLRSLPRTTTHRAVFFVVPTGQGLRLSQIDTPEAVPVTGLQRLQLFTDLAPLADSLKIFSHPSRQVSEWQLQCGPLLIQLTITAEVSRGFSGEGQVLTELAESDATNLAKLRAALKWQSLIDVSKLACQLNMSEEAVRKTLALLGSRGLVGYDVVHGAYFHREMPFDLELVEQMHPRLKNARQLLNDGKVKILVRSGQTTEIQVAGTDVQHRVVIREQDSNCTCPWHAKYQGSRGPCKHILAAQIAVSDAGEEEY
jgi:hypothetical protein